MLPDGYPLSWHSEPEFLYMKRGRRAYWVRDRAYPMEPLSFLIVRPNEIHRLLPGPDPDMEIGMVIFPRALFAETPRLFSFLRRLPRHIRLTQADATRIEMIINSIIEEKATRPAHWDEMIRAELQRFLVLVRRLRQSHSAGPPRYPRIVRVVDYIDRNFRDSLSLSGLAQMFSFSPNHLSSLFRKSAGMGLKQHIIERRIMEAKRLPEQSGELKVSAVAERVGFRSFGEFNRDFKRVTGATPYAYRRISSKR